MADALLPLTTDALTLRLAPEALTESAAAFRETGRVRVAPAYPDAIADALHRHLDTELPWSRAVNQGEKVWDIGPEGISAMAGGGDAALIEAVHRAAQDGFQFLFDTVRVADEAAQRTARGLLLDRLIDGLNTPESLETLRRLTGLADIGEVDGQATRYLRGHFLTGHDDNVAGKDRLAAYVLSLTPRWRTEWGGLLQFHGEDGDLDHAFGPQWNALHLFRVPQRHSVSSVAPFAGAPRYSVTGWLRRG
jgi:SM-20-related protein